MCGSSALVLFYHGLSLGQVSLVTPVASCGAVVPVLVGLLRGEALSWFSVAGIALALVGIVLVSLHTAGAQAHTHARRALAYALAAALAFGLFFVFAANGTAVPGAQPLWVALAGRAGGLSLLLAFQLGRGRRLVWLGWPRFGRLAAIGVIDIAATVCYTIATLALNLGVVAVLASLYPVVTILLGRLMLAERLSPRQYAGVGLALCGVVLLALP
jgi:drug/metabolite transporter (DMT)-like permease